MIIKQTVRLYIVNKGLDLTGRKQYTVALRQSATNLPSALAILPLDRLLKAIASLLSKSVCIFIVVREA